MTCRSNLDIVWHLVLYHGSYLSVPLFYFASGMTLATNLERRRINDVAIRAIQIILIGFAMTFYIMGPDQWLHTYVLQSIGIGLLLMSALSHWGWGPILLYILAVTATIWNTSSTSVLVPDFASHETVVPVLADGVRALFVDGAFAVLPWSGFIALGYLFIKHDSLPALSIFFLALMVTGALLGIDKYPMSAGYLLFFSGFTVLCSYGLSLVSVQLHFWMHATVIGRTWNRFSRRSLEIFVIHYLLGHGIAVIFPGWRLSFPAAVALGIASVLLAAGVLAVFDGRNRGSTDLRRASGF